MRVWQDAPYERPYSIVSRDSESGQRRKHALALLALERHHIEDGFLQVGPMASVGSCLEQQGHQRRIARLDRGMGPLVRFDMRDAPATPGNVTAKERSHTRSVSRRTAFILVWAVGVPLAHGVAPWAISLLSPRYGWEPIGPGIWNFVGLIPIALGIAGLAWTMVAAFVQTPNRVELRLPAFLLTQGPYAYSRNPMYDSELALWLGWAVFYGSVGVLIGFVILFAVLVPGVRYEERVLDARFGDAYRAYRSRVPRWLGTRRQREPRTSSS